MNYTIYANSDLIYNKNVVNGNGELPFIVLEPTLDEKSDGFSALTYRCLRGSPAYDRSDELKTRIKVYEDGNLYWQGRVLNVTKNIRNQKEIYVEDLLGMLCDAIYEPFDFYGTVSEFLNQIVAYYNGIVNASQRFVSVVCDVDEGNIVRSSEGYNTCWGVLKAKLLDMIGGYMWVSYNANEEPILHYSMNPRRITTQKIEFGKNLKDYNVKWSFDGFYTACIPLGAKDDETKEYVTIESINDGSKLLIDSAAAAEYGVIFAPPEETTWDDVTLPSNLWTRAQNWLQTKAVRAVEEINLSGLDLATLGVDVWNIRWLDAVQVSCTDFTDLFILKSVSRRLDDLASVEITMGDERSSLTGSAARRESSTIERIENIESDYVTNGEVRTIAKEEIQNDTSIIQRAESIIATALEQYVRTSDYETFTSTITSQFEILAGEIEARFTSTESEISTLSGETEQQLSTIHSFIRLLATTSTQEGGIVIGESTSSVMMKLENDVLYFFSGDETLVTRENAIAYFETGKLFVNEVQVQKISIGTVGQMMYFSVIGTGDNRCLFLNGRLS